MDEPADSLRKMKFDPSRRGKLGKVRFAPADEMAGVVAVPDFQLFGLGTKPSAPSSSQA